MSPLPPQSKAKCFRCGAYAQANTFEQARNKLDHAIGLARGIKCGNSYGKVKEIGKPKPPQPQPQTVSKIKKEQQIISDTDTPKIKKFKDIQS